MVGNCMNWPKKRTTAGYGAKRYKIAPSLNFFCQICLTSYGSLKRMSYIKSAVWSDEMKHWNMITAELTEGSSVDI